MIDNNRDVTEREYIIEYRGRTSKVTSIDTELIQAILPTAVDQLQENKNSAVIMGIDGDRPKAVLLPFDAYMKYKHMSDMVKRNPNFQI